MSGGGGGYTTQPRVGAVRRAFNRVLARFGV